MTPDQKRQARDAIRLWVEGDVERSTQENPLAQRHKFTEQVQANGTNQTVRAAQTRQSGGSSPVTYQKNSYEYSRMRRIMELVEDQEPEATRILQLWGEGHTFDEVAAIMKKGDEKYKRARAYEQFNIGLSLVAFSLMASNQNILLLGGLIRSNRM